jgi:S-adenosylmethionine-diacylglycerol 3-amino-3-carboxypropyl transferase
MAAIHLDFPLNGQFLGYSDMKGKIRSKFFWEYIRPHLSAEDTIFWDQNLQHIENGIVNAGRFEQYIQKMRFVVNLFIGKQNLFQLINSKTLEEQKTIFNKKIATRKNLQLLFKLAFHPVIYKKRGLQEQALIHAGKTTGERFYSKFEDFCTSGLAAKNHFLQYFLTGNCIIKESFPAYLQPANKNRLMTNLNGLEFQNTSFQDALNRKEKGHYNKIHLSNLGDWLSEEDFAQLLELLKKKCNPGTKICYRYLQKNHFVENELTDFSIDKDLSALAQKQDRFPFYGILSITMQPR